MLKSERSSRAYGFSTNCLIVVQSLEPHEVQTGTILAEFVQAQRGFQQSPMTIELCNVESANDFDTLLSQLAARGAAGLRPILHVECHGDEHIGLEFANGSVLDWTRLATRLREINMACDFNLVASFAACYGGHFLRQMGTLYECPCYALVAPTKKTAAHELMEGYRAFYRLLFEHRHVTTAIDALKKLPLSEGEWLAEIADGWFLRIATDYARNQCSVAEMRRRIALVHKELRQNGVKASMSSTKRHMLANHSSVFSDFFNEYFALAKLPHNAHRFAAARMQLGVWLEGAKKTGRYWI